VKLVLYRNGQNVGGIVQNLPANQGTYAWAVGQYQGGPAPAGGGYSIRIRTMDNGPYKDSLPFSIVQPPSGAFALTSPNGGESWHLGETKLITWNPGTATGTVRLDLYKGATTTPADKVGLITANTSAASGHCSWEVGKYIGGTAQAGSGYRIVVSSYSPAMTDAGDGTFTIAPKPLVPTQTGPTFSLTMPRRGEHWYKGTGYTITWTTGGLAGSPVRLELMKLDGSTLVQAIAANIPNNGQYSWAVPMSLPDAETLYKMRLRTMDGQHTDTTEAFWIAKAAPPAGPPAIVVTAPGGPSQIAIGSVLPIRWRSTCGTSPNGPTDDTFTIDLMDAAGTTKVSSLYSGQATYVQGNPDGSHDWRWDWIIYTYTGFHEPGKYRIRVANHVPCIGLGQQFQLVYNQQHKEYTLTPTNRRSCVYVLWLLGREISVMNSPSIQELYGPQGLVQVGFYFLQSDLSHNFKVCYMVWRGFVQFGDANWYKDKGHLLEAKLTIKRKWKTGDQEYASTAQALGGVVLLDSVVPCESMQNFGARPAPPPLSGVSIPVGAIQGDTWTVDLTQPYQLLMQSGRPDLGLMLYPVMESAPVCDPENPTRAESDGYICYQNAHEGFTLSLYTRFAKDIVP
jgi:hypothetical protein